MELFLKAVHLLAAAAILIPAVLKDITSHRIPNTLCLAGFLAGLILNGVLAGWTGFGHAFLAGTVLLLAGFPFFAVGWLGAGDVKLLAATGAIAGSVGTALAVLVATVLVGALMAIVTIVRVRSGKRLAKWITDLEFLAGGGYVLGQSSEPLGPVLPYSIAIAIGSLTVLALKALGGI